jgi:hypothetical protein
MGGPDFLVVLAPLGLFAMIFGIVYLKTRENMAMIEKGMNPKVYNARPAAYRNLKTGALLIGAGLGLLLAFVISYNMVMGGHDDTPIFFSLIAIGGGLGLIASYKIEKKELVSRNNTDRP